MNPKVEKGVITFTLAAFTTFALSGAFHATNDHPERAPIPHAEERPVSGPERPTTNFHSIVTSTGIATPWPSVSHVSSF